MFKKYISLALILTFGMWGAAEAENTGLPENLAQVLKTNARDWEVTDIHGIKGVVVNPHESGEENYNHTTERNGLPIQVLGTSYTVGTAESALDRFTRYESNADAGTSCHFMVLKNGLLMQIVDEKLRAHFMGPSEWGDVVCDTKQRNGNSVSRGLNSQTVGVIFENAADKPGEWDAFTQEQKETAIKLMKALTEKHSIAAENVIGWGDSRGKIVDGELKLTGYAPGPLFPWRELFENGVGSGLTEEEQKSDALLKEFTIPETEEGKWTMLFNELRTWGYNVPKGVTAIRDDLLNVIKNFRSHYSANGKPEAITDEVLRKFDEDDLRTAVKLNNKYNRRKAHKK